ncbi:COQ9 family protein [Candidatus Tisiphia endosymbiont of Nemotelus uliginosus]|uniref:COQ9 family protein n=1 Tax=Candidatus Tisiphia endosymbiont of Nemotelus uliginosus TaxID=3077926 RepID=UPI0035C8F25D
MKSGIMSDIALKHHNLKVLLTQTLAELLLFDEWGEKLLGEAEARCGFMPGYWQIIFPNGIIEIIDFLENQYDQKMLELLSEHEIPSKIRDRIDLALKIRIKYYEPKLIHLKNSIYFARPTNITAAIKIAMRTCNLIWRYAGDQSIDHNYYTKRGLLLGVYVSSIVYYIQDDSENNLETDQYITESLSDIVNITSKLKNVLTLPKMVDIPIIRLFS